MDLKDVKHLIRNGERVIIVEDGKPTLVILPFEEYDRQGLGMNRALNGNNGNNGMENDTAQPPEEEFTLDDLPIE
ncbi:MAG: hypothetical protein HY458_00295 [Parcubacteria group bacterium]|nr:hypothetical protein [Parcubacteria group bacterium]